MFSPSLEWLEADGHGGFASGTSSGVRTRRYHALLLTATTPPTGRMVLVSGIEAWVETPTGRFAISSQRYVPDVIHPDGASRIEGFTNLPWPTWQYRLTPGVAVEHELFVHDGVTHLVWRLRARGNNSARLFVRPLIAGRDYHALHHENGAFDFTPVVGERTWTWRPYRDGPAIEIHANAAYGHAPEWYRQFLYTEEHERGLDAIEDLASPGVFEFDLARGDAALSLAAISGSSVPVAGVDAARDAERTRRSAFGSTLERAADAYFVTRDGGKTIVAGYPWFTDWGRDTFIALRGLALTTGRLADARDILLAWSGEVSDGMLPNRFADQGGAREYNSVDASLWYVVAVNEFLALGVTESFKIAPRDRARLLEAADAILEGYKRGTRHGIHLDTDGLIAAGEPGVQLTWMDAKIGDWVVTPRVGKPVEIQALWLAALAMTSKHAAKWKEPLARGLASFAGRFWYEEKGYLYDVVDVDHVVGRVDPSLRPNQIFAVGGLPISILEGQRARSVVDAVERELLTPLGLRSLARDSDGYRPHYRGGVLERDGAYHQGTVWPWLIGPFVEAWVRARGDTEEAKREAARRFVEPLIAHTRGAGLGHVSEVADAEEPFTPGGCPFQAWSLGELLRAERLLRTA